MGSHAPTATSPVPPLHTRACGEHNITVTDELGGDGKERAEVVQRGQWLRAAMLGANDGVLSTTSLMLGVSAAKDDRWSMVVSGIAGAVAGAFSMAVGEFVSVFTQREIELAGSQQELSDHDHEVKLRAIAEAKSPGRSPVMRAMATENRNKKEEDGKEMKHATLPSPVKAAAASGLSFIAGSLVPLLSSAFVDQYTTRVLVLVAATSIALAGFGGLGAHLGGSAVRASAVRVLVGGWVAMGFTYWMLRPLGKDKD